jgi:hypothetical protein
MSERKDRYRDFFAELESRDLLAYGAEITTETVHALLGIKLPQFGTKSQFDQASLIELAAVDYVRGQLLKVGRYIAGTPSGYRVLLPSENAKQVEMYIDAAQRKLSRAAILSKNTPRQYRDRHDQVEARIELARSGMRSRFRPSGDAEDAVLN